MRRASAGVIALSISAYLIGLAACSSARYPSAEYNVGDDVTIVAADPIVASKVQMCDSRRRPVEATMLSGDTESPNGAWIAIESHGSFDFRSRTTRKPDILSFVSKSGDAVAATDFPRVFRLPVPYAQDPIEWVAGHGQRLRYGVHAGDRGRGRAVDHDIPSVLLAPPASKCIR